MEKYTSKNSGRHDFHIDLAIALMNYAIKQDLDGGSERPSWMRQKAFVSCNCGECYFCIHGHKTGMQHRQKNQKVKLVHLKSGTLARTGKCSNNVCFNLGKASVYCRQCMRTLLEGAVDGRNNKSDRDAKKRLCTYSLKGGFLNPGVGSKYVMCARKRATTTTKILTKCFIYYVNEVCVCVSCPPFFKAPRFTLRGDWDM